MASDWIKVCKETIDKPEISILADGLGMSREEAFGWWFRLYAWADSQTADGYVKNRNLRQVADMAHVPAEVCQILASREIGWLMEYQSENHPEERGVVFVNFDRHNGKSAKKRATTAKRVAKFRLK